ncbi:MAG: ABC-F family ATP-binding cassette domain-containing protein [Candidatus Promineifilaceae bacterium]
MAEILINVDKATVSLAGRIIFSELSWEIQRSQRVGLVGPNGAGKSTLLKLIADELPADEGNVFRLSGLTWGWLIQEPEMSDGRTIWEEARLAIPEVAAVETKLRKLEGKMGQPEVYGDPDALERIMQRHERAMAEYERLDGIRYEARVKEALTRLGFEPDVWDRPTDLLSGGQKKLVLLAKLAVQQPRLLLLDEPDNHLDITAKRHLEAFINSYPGCVVIISHDRYLLDEVATHIAELENGRLTLYPGNYTAYTTERELRRLRQQQMYMAQQKEIARIEAAIARFELWASMVVNERHIKQARSRQKMLDRMDKVEKVTDARRMSLDLAGWRGSNKVIELINVSKVFEDGTVLWQGLNEIIWHNERVGLVGPNGVGKSMLLKQLLNPEGVSSGEIRLGPSSRIGYYDQEHENLDYGKNLIDDIRQVTAISRESAVAFLNRFLFSYDQMQGKIGDLSGGERSRFQLAKLVLERPNLLLLDEPTNNLDIASIEVLEETLDEFVGTVLVISHDRYFLDKVVDRVIELQPTCLRHFDGGYTDYLDVVGI